MTNSAKTTPNSAGWLRCRKVQNVVQRSWVVEIKNEYVTSSANSGAGSLRQAIVNANANDLNNNGTTIHIQLAHNDPIELTSNLPPITARLITIAGDPGYRPLVDGNGSHQLFTFTNTSILAAVRNLVLQFGQSSQGDCIYTEVSGMLNIENVSFFACEAQASTNANGGAIYAKGPVRISESQFVTNYANTDTYAHGGAIYLNAPNKSMTITDSQFVGNKAVGVGATASTSGGAIYAGTDTDVAIEHSSFVDNEALTPARPGVSSGGAIVSLANHLQITRSSLVSNKADTAARSTTFRSMHLPKQISTSATPASYSTRPASAMAVRSAPREAY